MSECLFCKIVNGEIPSESIFKSEKVYAFRDIYPQAKEHILFIHKNHTSNISEMSSEEFSDVFSAIKDYAIGNNLEKEGFRVVNNCGELAGQSVFHTHFHVLFGEKLGRFGS